MTNQTAPPPRLVREGFHGFNIVLYQDRFWALPQNAGPMDLSITDSETLTARGCFVRQSLRDLLLAVAATLPEAEKPTAAADETSKVASLEECVWKMTEQLIDSSRQTAAVTLQLLEAKKAAFGGRYLDSAELQAMGFGSVGEHVRVHSSCEIAGIERIHIGSHVRIDAFCSLITDKHPIRIGNYVHIASYVFVSGGEGVEIGDFAGLSQGVRVLTRNDDYSGEAMMGPMIPLELRRVTAAPVVFERHSCMGASTVVLPGVVVGEGTVVGALSLVKRSLEPWGIYAGIPVTRRRERSREVLALAAKLTD